MHSNWDTCLEIFNWRGYIGGFTSANFRFTATLSFPTVKPPIYPPQVENFKTLHMENFLKSPPAVFTELLPLANMSPEERGVGRQRKIKTLHGKQVMKSYLRIYISWQITISNEFILRNYMFACYCYYDCINSAPVCPELVYI